MPKRARAPAFTLRRFGAAGRSERRESEGKALSLDHPAFEHLTKCSLLRRVQIPGGVDGGTRLA